MAGRHPLTLATAVAATVALAATVSLPGLASEPESSSLTAEPDATVVANWEGTAPPGLNDPDLTFEGCDEAPVADQHTVELTVPEGLVVDARVAVDYSGEASDLKLTVVFPDGSTRTVDGGFVDSSEGATFPDVSAGSYEIHVCAYAAAQEQAYAGAFEVKHDGDSPLTVPGPACRAFSRSPGFEMAYVDTERAGGEPIMTVHPDGQVLWGSHAGTTHFYTPAAADETSAAFVQNYEGQTYQYVSEDGSEWQFVPRRPIPDADTQTIGGVPASGFSDPEFAVDAAGNVYISEINLANVAVSKSTDGGRSYGLQNVLAFSMTDRQWMAADGEDELYMTGNGFGGGPFFPGTPAGMLGHFMAKSTDGGVTWNEASTTNRDGVADIRIDRARGILYELTESGGTLSMARFPNIREEVTDFTVETFPIAEGLGLTGVQRLIDPTFALDDDGNLYTVWTDNGTGERPQGIYYSYSTDQGESWALPHRVDPDDKADVWPWIAVGDPGQVSIVWLQADRPVDGALPGEEGGEDVTWHVMSATSPSGLGCQDSARAGFSLARASSEPVHTGTICQHGTACQTDLTDRRLGDYFSNVVDDQGRIHIAVSDTRQGGAVALPLHIRQSDGPLLRADGPGRGDDRPGRGDDPPGHGDDRPGRGDDPPGRDRDTPGRSAEAPGRGHADGTAPDDPGSAATTTAAAAAARLPVVSGGAVLVAVLLLAGVASLWPHRPGRLRRLRVRQEARRHPPRAG